MLNFNSNISAGTGSTRSEVSVFLNQGLADQKEWRFERQFIIGRGGTSDICIKDPIVSRFHAFVYLIGGKWWIRDMNSSNGIFINGKPVSKYPVNDQTKLQLGQDGPSLHLCSDNSNSSDSETVLVDLSDFNKNDDFFFDMNIGGKRNIKDIGSAPAEKDKNKSIKTSFKKIKKENAQLNASLNHKAANTINEALRYYAEGKIKSSINLLNRMMENSNTVKFDLKKRADIFINEIVYAKSLYSKANQAITNGQIDTAKNTLAEMLQVDQKLLGNKKGYFSRIVCQKIADGYSDKAMKEFTNVDFPSAYRHIKMALYYKGNHPKALKVKNMLNAKSRRLYKEGHLLKQYNSEIAMEKWELITKICDSNSAYYQMALGKINKNRS